MLRTVLLLLLVLVPATGLAAPAATHPFSVHDMLAMDRIVGADVSPDGRTVVFVVSRTDLDHNRRRTDLWAVGADGAGLRQLTSHEASDTDPRWSPDGRAVFFLSSRSGSSQVWRLPADGGEAVQVTRQPLDVGSFRVTPDGTKLVVSMEVFAGTTVAETQKRLDAEEARARSGPSGMLYDHLFVRHWDTWVDGRRAHLFVVPAGGGEAVDLMKDMDADCPTKPYGGAEDYVISPDGATVAFSARNMGRAEAWSTNFDLFAVPLDGSAAPKDITAGNPAWDAQPVFSPDGRTLAYLAMKTPDFEADRFRIVLRTWADGKERVLTEAWDRSPGTITWAPDGRSLYASAENLGQTSLFSIDAATGKAHVVVEKGTVAGFAPSGERVVYGLHTLTNPTELYSVRSDGTDPRRLSHFNDEKVAAARMGEPEQFSFKGAHGDVVYGYIVKPVDFDPAKKYPVAFLIHGGPQGSFGNDFHYRWNPEAYAGAGYATVAVDFHGSTGYGEAFQEAIRDDWGGGPLVDLQKGLAAALATHPWMDGTRVGALGASFGAYMTNWIAGNWPDRFRCLVTHDGDLDERSAYYATEELWFPEFEHHGTPWENPKAYERQNPVNFVKNWKTPTLVVHGGLDFRIPYASGLETFTVLQRKGIPSKFLFFPDENHWVLKPKNSILWHDTVLAWLDEWLKPGSTASAAH
jgi:dipeptidyl aminopeptidase/acylaminoacyl peptidase